jgi:hypothetical protein
MLVVGMVALAALLAIIPEPKGQLRLKIVSYDEDFLLVRTISSGDNLPLTNVTLNISKHDGGIFLSGPYLVNETGYAILQIPNGYSECFDIVGNYKGVTQTFTFDIRGYLAKAENKLVSLVTGLIFITYSSVLTFLGWSLRDRTIKKKVPETDGVKEKNKDKISAEHQP